MRVPFTEARRANPAARWKNRGGRHLPGARGTWRRFTVRARFRAGAVAVVAGGKFAKRDLSFHAARRLLSEISMSYAQIRAFAGAIGATTAAEELFENTAAAAKHLAEHVERIWNPPPAAPPPGRGPPSPARRPHGRTGHSSALVGVLQTS